MKSEKVSCGVWLGVFLALCGAAGWFVWRRAPNTGAVLLGGFVGGILLLLVLSFLLAIPDRIREWLLIVQAKLGREPRDGKRIALIGTLRGHGDLSAPFSRRRCIAYAYEIHMRQVLESDEGTSIEMKKAFEGFAMAPLSIEHGTERTRILAKPEIPFETSQPEGPAALASVKEYVAGTDWIDTAGQAPANDQPDLTHTDGRHRADYRNRPDADLSDCTFVEKILTGNASACAIGTYSEDKRALLPPVKLRTGAAFAIGAAWRVVNAGIGLAIFTVIAGAVALLFCLNHPLDAAEAERPDRALIWPEIDLERFLAREVRPRMVRAGILSETSGYYLQDVCMHCARGRLVVNGRTIELRHAAHLGDAVVHITAAPGDRDGITLLPNDEVRLTLDGRTAPIPASWFQPNDVVTSLGSGKLAEYSGRVTIVAPDGWLRARVTFKTAVTTDVWLRGR